MSEPVPPCLHRVPSFGGVTLTLEEYGTGDRGAAILFLPALGVPLSYYRRLLTTWAANGRRVIGVETRGMPQSPVPDLRRGSFGYADLVRRDLPEVFGSDVVRSAGRVVVVGHSLGGHLALLSAASGTVTPDALVTVATGTSSPASQRTRYGRAKRVVGVRFIGAVASSLGYWPGHRLGFGGRQPSALMHDWGYEGRHGRYRLGGDPTDYEAALATLTLPTLLVGFQGDRMVPAEAVDHLAGRLPAHVGRATVVDGHAADHFLWARRSPETVIDEVERWLTPIGL